MNDVIQAILEEKVNPVLAAHFGGAQLVSLDNNVAKVRMTGACAACPSARFTIENVVKEIVMENCGDIEDVVLDTSASEELMETAKKIMNKE